MLCSVAPYAMDLACAMSNASLVKQTMHPTLAPNYRAAFPVKATSCDWKTHFNEPLETAFKFVLAHAVER